MGARTYELQRCANPRCPVGSASLPHLVAGWPGGRCPSCQDPQDAVEVRSILDRCRSVERQEQRLARPQDAGK